MKKLLLSLLIIAVFCTFALTESVAQADTLDLNNLMSKPNGNYQEVMAPINEIVNQTGTHATEAEDYDNEVIQRWNWFWKNRLDGGSSSNPGGFDMAYKNLLGLVLSPVCNTYINNGSNWSCLGPFQDPYNSTDGGMGLVNAVAHVVSNPNIIYIGTNASGVWKTLDGGQNWSCITDVLRLPGLGVQDVKIDPNNPDVVYMATGITAFYGGYGIGVLRSGDGGATWLSVTNLTFTPTSRKICNRILVDHFSYNSTLNYSMNVYALVENFVYKSTNGGFAFTQKAQSEIVTPTNGSVRYWRDIEMKPGDPNTLYISSDDRGMNDGGAVMMKTNDGGNTWTTLNFAASAALSERISIGVCNDPATQANNIWIVYTTQGIGSQYVYVWFRKSTDEGNTWSTLYSANLYQGYGTVLGGCDFWRQDIVIPDHDPNVIYALGYFMNKSINGGSSFSQQSGGLHPDIRALHLVASTSIGGPPNGGDDVILLGTDGGIAKTEHGGSLWSYINGHGLAITQFYGLCSPESNVDIIASGSQDNGYFSYIKGGYTNDFKRINVGDAYDCVCDQNFQTNQVMYGESNGGSYTLKASNSGGSDWNYLMANIPTQPHSHLYPMETNADNQNYYTAGHDVYTSQTIPITAPLITLTNTPGSRLSNFSDPNPPYHVPSCNAISAIAVAPSDHLVIYAAFELPTWNQDIATCDLNCTPGTSCFSCGITSSCPLDKKIFVTHDGGASWNDIGKFMNAAIYTGSTDAVRWSYVNKIAIDPTNPDRVWMCFGGFWNISGIAINKVNYSPDGGLTWIDFTDGLPDFPANTIIYQNNSNDLLYVGTDVGVFYRDATMSQWECFTNDLPVCIITDLEINYCSQKIRASTFGRGLWESDLAISALPIATQTWTSPTSITSDLIIQGTLTIQTDVNVAKGRRITVEPGATLDINGGHLFNGCDEMWDRIELVDPTSTLIIRNGAIVEDAYVAGNTTNGGVIQIENSTLDQNQVHVHIENATGSSPYPGYIKGSTLENTTGLQRPFTPGTLSNDAIQIENSEDVIIGDDASSSQKNIIKDFLQCGIRITNSSATIINNDISTIVTTGIPRGVSATNNTAAPLELNIGSRTGLNCTAYSKNHFSNLYLGIWINKDYTVNIVDNDLEQIRSRGIFIVQCVHAINVIAKLNPLGNYIHNSPNIGYGIELINNPNASSINISENNLDLNNNAVGIYLLEYSCIDNPNTRITGNVINNIRQGIWVVNDGLPLIADNRINFTTIPPSSLQGYGINVQNCCYPDIENNEVTATGAAKPLGGINVELCERPYICNNTVKYMEKGIICRGPMPGTKVKLNIMDGNHYGFCLENSGDIGLQGALPYDVSDNQWINNIYFDSYCVTGSNPTNASHFLVRGPGVFSINTWFGVPPVLSSILAPYLPADCSDHYGWRPADEEAEDAIQNAAVIDSVLSEEEKWLMTKQVYNFVTGDSTIDTSSSIVIQDFKTDVAPEPVGKFNEVDNSISLAFNDTLAIRPDSLKLDSAQLTNTAIVTIKLIEFYKKIVNDIYLSTVARDNLNFTTDHLTWLYEIAPLCPFEAGPAVYQARMLVALVNDSITFNDELCDSTAHFRVGHSQDLNSLTYFNVYPNPAKDILYVDYILSKDTKGIFVLSDVTGKELLRQQLYANANQATLHCDKLSAGIYIYKISTNGTLVKTGKLVKN